MRPWVVTFHACAARRAATHRRRWSGASAVAAAGDELWVALPQRHSVCVVGRDGAIVREVGGFATPTGLAFHSGRLLVSDGGCHELSVVDPKSGGVETVLGTGQRGTDRHGGGFGTQQPLSSPAGACSLDGAVYFAHAGTHQRAEWAAQWVQEGATRASGGAESPPESASAPGVAEHARSMAIAAAAARDLLSSMSKLISVVGETSLGSYSESSRVCLL